MHKRKTVHEKKFKPNIPLVVEGLSLQDLIGDVSEYDSGLVAAYDIIAADLPQVVFSNQDEDNIEEQGLFTIFLAVCLHFFLITVFAIYIHTDRACSRLVYLFKHSLDLSKHFMYLRQIFFMEAGDLLSEFYTPMFSKIGMYINFKNEL